MPCILNIETSTAICSVAVAKDGEILSEYKEIKALSHASILGVFVKEVITFLRQQNLTLDAIAVSCGPGSYTGLRIGVSEAKGLCYGLDIPLIAINTLNLMAAKMVSLQKNDETSLFCPMIDARRMEVYAAIYDRSLNLVRDIQADIVDENSYLELLASHQIIFFGNGADKCKTSINSANAIFVDDIYPLAVDMIELAEQAFTEKKFVDTAYFEPFYLKEFVATVAKNKVL